MKTGSAAPREPKNLPGFTYNPELDKLNLDNAPLFKKKMAKVEHIIKTYGLPPKPNQQ